MTRLVFDIEADSLLYDIENIWCVVTKDLDTSEVKTYSPERVIDGLKSLSDADIIIGHNICGYDIPAIQKLLPEWTYKDCRDTYCMSKLFCSERGGGHSIESYGEFFGRKKSEHKDFKSYTQELLYRCSEDVEIGFLTYNYLVNKYCLNWKWIEALRLEQEVAYQQAMQEVNGVDFDTKSAVQLIDRIDREVAAIDELLKQTLPKRTVQVGKTVEKVFDKSGQLLKRIEKMING